MLLKFSTVVVIETVRSGSGIKLLRGKYFQKYSEVIKATPQGEKFIWYSVTFFVLCCFTSFVDNKEAEAIYQVRNKNTLFLPDSCFLFSSGK